MSDRLRVAAIGTVIEIEVPERGRAFADRVRDGWADAATDDAAVQAVVAARPTLDDDAALAMLSTDVTLAALEQRRGEALWMLHAAGLADAEGRVVVLSAPSGTGKTTAARHLSRRLAYVSDETVAIAADGLVVPYRKPLSVIEPGTQHKVQVAPSSIHGLRELPGTLTAVKVVVLDRRDDAPEIPTVEPLDLAAALEMLAPQSSYLSDMPSPLHTIRAILGATGGAVRVSYREVETLDGLIDEFLSTPPVLQPVPVASAPFADEPPLVPSAAGYERTPVVDALALDDGRLALLRRSELGSRLHILDGIGPTVWEASHGRTLAEITAAVVAVHGRPEGADPEDLVRAAVAQLTADDLLRLLGAQT